MERLCGSGAALDINKDEIIKQLTFELVQATEQIRILATARDGAIAQEKQYTANMDKKIQDLVRQISENAGRSEELRKQFEDYDVQIDAIQEHFQQMTEDMDILRSYADRKTSEIEALRIRDRALDHALLRSRRDLLLTLQRQGGRQVHLLERKIAAQQRHIEQQNQVIENLQADVQLVGGRFLQALRQHRQDDMEGNNET